ncbi:unnamed protein product, partial [Clonostachys rhizophaga]
TIEESKAKLTFTNYVHSKRNSKGTESKIEKAIVEETISEAEDILLGITNRNQLASLVQHLYLTICTLNYYKRNKDPPGNAIVETDKALLEGWKALLKTIKALSTEVPSGHFLAARMMLFLMHAFQKGFLYDLQDSAMNRDEVKL